MALARTSSTTLTGSDKSRHPCSVPDLRGKFQRMTFIVDFNYCFHHVEVVPVYSSFVECFYHERVGVEFCHFFFNQLKWSCRFLYLHLVGFITSINSHILNNPAFHKLYLVILWNSLINCWILFDSISLKIFALMFIKDVGLYFSCSASIHVWYKLMFFSNSLVWNMF